MHALFPAMRDWLFATWRRRWLSPHARLGHRGEQFAARHLRRRGYRVIERNYTIGHDEVDIVVESPDHTIVLVEVKTRRSDDPPPEWSVGPRKQMHLARMAARMEREQRFADRRFRFDVVAVVWPEGKRPELRHHVGAFESVI